MIFHQNLHSLGDFPPFPIAMFDFPEGNYMITSFEPEKKNLLILVISVFPPNWAISCRFVVWNPGTSRKTYSHKTYSL
jgi:hypothetical protein